MISLESLSEEWIMSIRGKAHVPADPILIEKMIHALLLLEQLRLSGLEFIFKGGTSLLLVLGEHRRFSIDIDILIEEDGNLQTFFRSVLQQGVFHRFEEQIRTSTIPKRHFKYFYESMIEQKESSIIMDLLIDANPYPVAIVSDLVLTGGANVAVMCPAVECLLGDKLTAFAPKTAGILYGTGKELEIIKQLYDLGLLFDAASDFSLVELAFNEIANRELAYRGLTRNSPADVLEDSFAAACLVGNRGYGSMAEFTELRSGIKKLAGFISSENYTLDSAIRSASKVAYTAALLKTGQQFMVRYDPAIDLADTWIRGIEYNRLNKIKKTDPEAFHYFYQAVEGIYPAL